MIYIRKLFTQDLRDGKQIAFPKEPSNVFFNFDFNEVGIKDRNISFTYKSIANEPPALDGRQIVTRLYAAGSESRIDGHLKAFLRDELKVSIDDFVIFRNNGMNYDKFTFSIVRQSDSNYLGLKTLLLGMNHSVLMISDNIKDTEEFCTENRHLQQIFYGAPGTGKSHCVKKETEEWGKKGRVVRTTFHPDSDYSTFVGTYKPTTESAQRYDIYNQPITRNGVPVMEQIITYNFVAQAFLQAYIDAWKNRKEPEFLIIEEINRGNCAQIFGDLFQLLDRGDNGFSEYTIRADRDLQKFLSDAFADIEIEGYPKVKSGEELLLPSNFYIRATMNTSDQSLFPIDSAFKRRWDWHYMPIAKGNDNGTDLDWKIDVDGNKYDWWTFIKRINKEVFEMTNSEDKQLGFFFCKAKDNIISAETFVHKVVFYLWNDVFKDFGFDDPIFADKVEAMNPKLSFDKFYMPNGEVNVEKIKVFFANLGIEPTFRGV